MESLLWLNAWEHPGLVAAFLAGLLSDWATYAATSLLLALGLHGDASLGTMFASIAIAFVPTQVPLGVLEGFMAAGAYRFRPEPTA